MDEYLCPNCNNFIHGELECECCGYEFDGDYYPYYDNDDDWIHDPDMGSR